MEFTQFFLAGVLIAAGPQWPTKSSDNCFDKAANYATVTGEVSSSWLTNRAYPARFNWLDSGKVTPSKAQQGQTCALYAAMGCLESRYLIARNERLNLSEQKYISCLLGQEQCLYPGGGGCIADPFTWYRTHGAVSENCFPTVPWGKIGATCYVPCGDTSSCPEVARVWDALPVPILPLDSGRNAWLKYFLTTRGPLALGNGSHADLLIGWDDSRFGNVGGWHVKDNIPGYDSCGFSWYRFDSLAVTEAWGVQIPGDGRSIYVDQARGSDDLGKGTAAQPFSSIKRALLETLNGDTVVIRSGTYSGKWNVNLKFPGRYPGDKGIVIRSASDLDQVVIDCNNAAMAFSFDAGVTTGAIGRGHKLIGITIRNAYPHALKVTDCSPSILNCSFVNGTGEQAVWIEGVNSKASPLFRNCVFQGNLSKLGGSAIYAGGRAELTVDSCRFRDNRVLPADPNYYRFNAGGAIAMADFYCTESPSWQITNSLFDHNVVDESAHARSAGGALWMGREYCSASYTISNCTFVNNRAQFGSAIGARGNYGALAINRNIFVTDSGLYAIGDTAAAPAGDRSTTLHGNLFHEPGQAVGGLLGCHGLDNTNQFEDPRFCDPGNGKYQLCELSPALPSQSACGQLVGAFDRNCDCGVVAASNQLSPMPGQFTGEPGVDLKWNPVTAASYYQVQVGDHPTLCSVSLTDTTSRSSYHVTRDRFVPGEALTFWRVRARAGDTWSRWSSILSFQGGNGPSCPVLFSYDGVQYQKENPLLTACEQTNYRESVTDYYLLQNPPSQEGGRVRLQLREMENETTFLDSFSLMVVDHPKSSKAAVTAGGLIELYGRVVSPTGVVDQTGSDRLGDVADEDGRYFRAFGPGFLTVTFPIDSARNVTLLQLNSGLKLPCGGPIRAGRTDPGETVLAGSIKAELLDQNGSWYRGSAVPARQWPVQNVVNFNTAAAVSSGSMVVKISWEKEYATDQICRIVPENLPRSISRIKPSRVTLVKSGSQAADNLPTREFVPVTLSKGDILEFSFEVPPSQGPETARDFIVCAGGRYVPTAASQESAARLPFKLSGNYPNPFNPNTSISYELEQPAHVKLTIYNINGQVVRLLVNADESSGKKSSIWDGRDDAGRSVASGVYLYRMEVGGLVASKKMVLLK